jgi:hypothetical protein
MKSIKLMKGFKATMGSALLGLMLATAAGATTEPVTAEVEFVAAILITETNALQFGLLDTAIGNTETVVIAPDGTVTDTFLNVQGGTQAAATFDVTAVNGKGITVTVANVNTPVGSGYALGTWRCDFAGAGEGDCLTGINPTAGPGAEEVRVGVTLTGDGTSPSGVKNSTFDLVVVYQ